MRVICACVENGQELLDLARVIKTLHTMGLSIKLKLVSLEQLYQDESFSWVKRELPVEKDILIIPRYFGKKKPFPYHGSLLKALAVLLAKKKMIPFCRQSDIVVVGIQSVFQRMLYTYCSKDMPFVSMHRALLFEMRTKLNRAKEWSFQLASALLFPTSLGFMIPPKPGVGYADYYFELGWVNRGYLIEQGVNPDKVWVTGSPTYDWFYTESGKLRNTVYRPSLVHKRPVKVCYITGAYEWIGDTLGEDFQRRKIANLVEFARVHQDVINVTIRVHPREPKDKYERLIQQHPHILLEYYNPQGNIFEDLEKHDIVIGTVSQVMYDSILMDKLAIFYLLSEEIERYEKFFQEVGLKPVRSFKEVVNLIEMTLTGETMFLKEYKAAQRSAVQKIIYLPEVKPSEMIAKHIYNLLLQGKLADEC